MVTVAANLQDPRSRAREHIPERVLERVLGAGRMVHAPVRNPVQFGRMAKVKPVRSREVLRELGLMLPDGEHMKDASTIIVNHDEHDVQLEFGDGEKSVHVVVEGDVSHDRDDRRRRVTRRGDPCHRGHDPVYSARSAVSVYAERLPSPAERVRSRTGMELDTNRVVPSGTPATTAAKMSPSKGSPASEARHAQTACLAA